jgi:soluble lytic murein transglycosylase-like protein
MRIAWLSSLLLLAVASLSASAQTRKQNDDMVERARRYEPYFVEASARHEVDARLLWVIAYLETRFNPRAVSRKGARGLMQLMPDTAARLGVVDPHDPAEAIDAAARYVRSLSKRFGERLDLVLAAYNAGETAVEAFLTGRTIHAGDKVINPAGRATGGIPPYRETQRYVAAGMRLLSGIAQTSDVIASRQTRSPDSRDEEGGVKAKPVSSSGPVRKSHSYSVSPDVKRDDSPSSMRRSIIYQ